MATRLFPAVILFGLLFTPITAAPAARAVGLLQDGDIVVPSEYCLKRIIGTNSVPWLTSDAFGWGHDAMEDSRGRIVFIAGAGNNVNSVALFRADPATGSLERLLMLPYIVYPGDTLPDRVGATGYTGATQSLHTEKTYGISLVDTVNGGLPQVGSSESYVFSTGAAIGGVLKGVAIRWLVNENRAEEAYDVSACNTSYGVYMTADGSSVYYGAGGQVFKVGPQLDISAHFNLGGVARVDADLRILTSNELIYDSPILDDRNIPNVTATCGSTTDPDVPMVGSGFNILDVGGLGVLGGSLYATTSCGCASTPYEFALAPRSPFLNPNICQYYKAVLFTGGNSWVLGDTMAITPTRGSSADGSSVLANADGNILTVSPGGASHLARDGSLRGRPLRWHAPSGAIANGSASATVAGDTSLTALVLRVDSLVRIIVTDPLGRRIGVTAADSVVNDFGSSGLVSSLTAGGWPKLITIVGPATGDHHVDIAGGSGGQYDVTAYLAETSTGGVKSPISGTIAAGEMQHRVLQVSLPLTLGWSPTAGVADGHPATTLGFDSVAPVPAVSTVRFACRVPEAGNVRLEMFDLSGRRVATLAAGARAAGPFTAQWSGRADEGRMLPSGVYLARLSMPGVASVRRVVLTR